MEVSSRNGTWTQLGGTSVGRGVPIWLVLVCGGWRGVGKSVGSRNNATERTHNFPFAEEISEENKIFNNQLADTPDQRAAFLTRNDEV
jgi:hypothetical protein